MYWVFFWDLFWVWFHVSVFKVGCVQKDLHLHCKSIFFIHKILIFMKSALQAHKLFALLDLDGKMQRFWVFALCFSTEPVSHESSPFRFGRAVVLGASCDVVMVCAENMHFMSWKILFYIVEAQSMLCFQMFHDNKSHLRARSSRLLKENDGPVAQQLFTVEEKKKTRQ